MSATYAVLGCGWLGLPLAESLRKSGDPVRGSVRRQTALAALEDVGVAPHLIHLHEDKVEGAISLFLEGVSRLYLTISPGLRKDPKRNFVAVIENLVPHIVKSQVREVVFTSSTSVYGSTQGVVGHDTVPLPDTESGRQLLAVEQLLLGQTSFATQILRLGGLVDRDRHPAQTLARKEIITEPQAPINLIHRTDAMGLLLHLPNQAPWNNVYHGVMPWHPSKKDFYGQAAKELGLPPLRFSDMPGATNKKVVDLRIENELGYLFKEPRLGLTNWVG